ncbi:hypothetical protein WA1_25125 [Scytonema hofmannii PCC 7110]|uniref:Uncharacterized protein n=1 Tax=Scytonema hofmannii PCC 7110 TaxID=128403 RepID=A0A139X8D4_9CYAN|nr:aminotransferase class III-fold pyridoxal phosphate-dependent enzyme [Scytonema hofmannii]KYC40902.1 hypothetical protein WA1_25125 [Scytonema hofmannii PCC 7110]
MLSLVKVTQYGQSYGTLLLGEADTTLDSLDNNNVLNQLKQSGFIVFRNFNVDLNSFSNFVQRLSFRVTLDPARQFYGAIAQKVDAGFDAVGLHCENGNSPFMPHLCWFFCEKASSRGSQTTVCDGYRVWDMLSPTTQQVFLDKDIVYSRNVESDKWKNFVFHSLQGKKPIGNGVAAVFLEPILGGAYLTVPPAGYLKEVETLCRQTNSLLVVDEIQTGFGRVGKMFAIEFDQVLPDIILLSKGITGGHTSIAIAVMRDTVVHKINTIQGLPARYLASESGGSPYACAAAVASIEFIRRNNLPERAQQLGQRLRQGLKEAARKYPKLILDAPGVGLMTGLRVRNSAVETAITIELGKHKIHVGHSMNESAKYPVLRFYPPLTVTAEEIDRVLAALHEVLTSLNQKPALFYDLFNQLVKRQYRLPKKLLFRLAGLKEAH